ncbi:hypothetical protein ACTXT7_017475 [Hymenolepis weldensis]
MSTPLQEINLLNDLKFNYDFFEVKAMDDAFMHLLAAGMETCPCELMLLHS